MLLQAWNQPQEQVVKVVDYRPAEELARLMDQGPDAMQQQQQYELQRLTVS